MSFAAFCVFLLGVFAAVTFVSGSYVAAFFFASACAVGSICLAVFASEEDHES